MMRALVFWASVEQAAEAEAENSPLPVQYNGPADAYRHIVAAAELRRRFGFAVAYAIVTGNEIIGTHGKGYRLELRQMDDHNNAIGLAIGATAKTYAEVVRLARAAIDDGAERGGTGAEGTPSWLPTGWREGRDRPLTERRLPVSWPDHIPSLSGYRFAAERYGLGRIERAGTPKQREAAWLERLADTPPAEWSEADVRAVIGSTPYLNRAVPGHEAWRDRVRAYFEHRTAADGATDDGCSGSAQVSAYTRRGPNGPVEVSGHSRRVSC
jgi:hypothetical protein